MVSQRAGPALICLDNDLLKVGQGSGSLISSGPGSAALKTIPAEAEAALAHGTNWLLSSNRTGRRDWGGFSLFLQEQQRNRLAAQENLTAMQSSSSCTFLGGFNLPPE